MPFITAVPVVLSVITIPPAPAWRAVVSVIIRRPSMSLGVAAVPVMVLTRPVLAFSHISRSSTLIMPIVPPFGLPTPTPSSLFLAAVRGSRIVSRAFQVSVLLCMSLPSAMLPAAVPPFSVAIAILA